MKPARMVRGPSDAAVKTLAMLGLAGRAPPSRSWWRAGGQEGGGGDGGEGAERGEDSRPTSMPPPCGARSWTSGGGRGEEASHLYGSTVDTFHTSAEAFGAVSHFST